LDNKIVNKNSFVFLFFLVVLLVVVVNRKQKVKQTLAGVRTYEGKNKVKRS
jgi:hypothetical protein